MRCLSLERKRWASSHRVGRAKPATFGGWLILIPLVFFTQPQILSTASPVSAPLGATGSSWPGPAHLRVMRPLRWRWAGNGSPGTDLSVIKACLCQTLDRLSPTWPPSRLSQMDWGPRPSLWPVTQKAQVSRVPGTNLHILPWREDMGFCCRCYCFFLVWSVFLLFSSRSLSLSFSLSVYLCVGSCAHVCMHVARGQSWVLFMYIYIKIFYNIYLFIFLCVCGGQKTDCKSQLFPPAMWVTGI